MNIRWSTSWGLGYRPSFFVAGFALLIWLRIWSYRRFNVTRKKAAHSTIKLILLSHVQMILLVLGLEVRWPRALIQVVRLLSSLVAISPENTQSLSVSSEIPCKIRLNSTML